MIRILDWLARLMRPAIHDALRDPGAAPQQPRVTHPHAVFQRIALEHFHE